VKWRSGMSNCINSLDSFVERAFLDTMSVTVQPNQSADLPERYPRRSHTRRGPWSL
jgi:hypothetical protein